MSKIKFNGYSDDLIHVTVDGDTEEFTMPYNSFDELSPPIEISKIKVEGAFLVYCIFDGNWLFAISGGEGNMNSFPLHSEVKVKHDDGAPEHSTELIIETESEYSLDDVERV